jgi:hypothetical protein
VVREALDRAALSGEEDDAYYDPEDDATPL